ncbi:hypothetical protein HYPSUDRAFT_1045277 [Hypholoma sublateritium FD-334 SS-4]|uniref:Uncharacterized protein n=1 Tax=Hypholoma sublateritium (strain FD-334 SS-4) TaxID=945553 RepID=A0A0D2P9L4_HYPSF|nr:hypothetical protein HYPSUDRAFT_1045277 [Hypholoma sublateritium FD-334 SS-4]
MQPRHSIKPIPTVARPINVYGYHRSFMQPCAFIELIPTVARPIKFLDTHATM